MGDRLGLITWDDNSPTGGNVYNLELTRALRRAGVDVEIRRVGAGWPEGTVDDRQQLMAALADSPVSLVDGIVAGNAPTEIAGAVEAGRRIAVLVHLPLADTVGLPAGRARTYLARERATLAKVQVVICPSQHAAAVLRTRYGRADAVVAPPGVMPAPTAVGSDPPHLLSLGALTPTKNQLALLSALRTLRALPWTATLAGSTRVDPDYAAQVAREAEELGVQVTGVLTGRALEREWARTDLLISTSRVETYGMGVAEALAHGIPAAVPAGTGAVEALGRVGGQPPGLAVDPSELSTVLRRWFTDSGLRRRWRDLALRRREMLPTWSDTAAIVRAALLDP